MSLADHSDASHLYETKTRSRVDAHLFMSNNTEFPPNNGAVLTVAKIIKAVMSSVAEDELGSLFIKCKEPIRARQPWNKCGKNNHQIPVQTDNTTSRGVVTNNIASKRLKSMNMRLHWV